MSEIEEITQPREFACVELKGYYTHVGRIYEQVRLGFTYGCVDTLENGEVRPVLFPPTSVFRITILTEHEVNDYYADLARRPVPGYDHRDDEHSDVDPFADDTVDYDTWVDLGCRTPNPALKVETGYLNKSDYMEECGHGYIDEDHEGYAWDWCDKSTRSNWPITHWRPIRPESSYTPIWDEIDDSRR